MPANYNRYLRSEQWKSIRDLVLDRDGHKCMKCGYDEDLTVHHKTYDHIFHEREHLEDLITLCKDCHWKEYNEEDLSHIPEELLVEGMVSVPNNRIYTKLFTKAPDPGFSRDTYYKYWYNICRSLSRDTNIIVSRKPRLHYIGKIKEFAKVCDGTEAAIYRFVKECREKRLIAAFELDAQKVFIANPDYTLNGNKIPILVSNLFKEVGDILDGKGD